MKIAFASDDPNATTDAVRAFLAEAGHDVVSPATSDAWPEIGAAVGKAVADGEADFGVEITVAFLSGIAPDPDESVNIARLGELDEPRR